MVNKLIIFILAALAFFVNINSFPLHNWDEAWYAEIIKNMSSGQYNLLVPFWNGQYYFDKPPLYFWLSLPVVKIFGLGEWQIRFVSAVGGFLTVLLIYFIAKKLFNQRVGQLSSLVFLSFGQVINRFSQGNLDAILVCLSLASFYFYLQSSEKKFFLILSGLSAGFGFLVKGWLMGLFPLLLIFLFLVGQKRKNLWDLLIIFLFSLLPFLVWSFLGFRNFGWQFVNWYWLHPAAGNLSGSLSLLTLFKTFFRDVGFWWLAIAIFVIKKGRKIFPLEKFIGFFILCATIYLFSLGFLKEQMDWYLLPAYPLLAIFVGYCLLRTSWLIMILLFTCQLLILITIQGKSVDRSKLMAEIGTQAYKIIPKGDLIVLDDSDFTTFLYYSNHQQIYVSSQSGGKPKEWWIIKYEQLPKLLKENSSVWLVSIDPNRFPLGFVKRQIVTAKQGFQFVKLSVD